MRKFEVEHETTRQPTQGLVEEGISTHGQQSRTTYANF